MEHFLSNFIVNASVFQKGVFLMIAGIGFVFIVQLLFYLIVKLWPKGKEEKGVGNNKEWGVRNGE